MTQPRLVVFDLDFTLWPYRLDTQRLPPFQSAAGGTVYDRKRRLINHYEDVPRILAQLHKDDIPVAIASRTQIARDVNHLISLFKWDKYFRYRQIHKGPKLNHFKLLHTQTGISYEEMIFFDDKEQNLVGISNLGVTCISLEEGLTMEEFTKGMEQFSQIKAGNSVSLQPQTNSSSSSSSSSLRGATNDPEEELNSSRGSDKGSERASSSSKRGKKAKGKRRIASEGGERAASTPVKQASETEGAAACISTGAARTEVDTALVKDRSSAEGSSLGERRESDASSSEEIFDSENVKTNGMKDGIATWGYNSSDDEWDVLYDGDDDSLENFII